MGRIAKTFFLSTLASLALSAHAAWLTNISSADAPLLQLGPTNNLGGHPWAPCGRTQNGTINRALFKFDLSNVPADATVLSAVLVLQVTGQPAEPPPSSTFGLHRMLRAWGEGNKFATGAPGFGQGLPASFGEVTWLFARYPTNAWAAPGGAADVDYSSTESSFQNITDLAPYRFESTPELVGDVQQWVRQPAANFGWMLICNDETIPFTARRFGTREDPNAPPVLVVEYIPAPKFDRIVKFGGACNLYFTANAGQSYAVEFRSALGSGSWQTLATIPAPAEASHVLVADSLAAPKRFYRLVAY